MTWTSTISLFAKAATLARLSWEPRLSKARDIYNSNRIDQPIFNPATSIMIAGITVIVSMIIGFALFPAMSIPLPLGAMITDVRCRLLHEKWAIGDGDGCLLSFQMIEKSIAPSPDWAAILEIYNRNDAVARRPPLTDKTYMPGEYASLEQRYFSDYRDSKGLLALTGEELTALAKAIETFYSEAAQGESKAQLDRTFRGILASVAAGADPDRTWSDAEPKMREAMATFKPLPPAASLRPRQFTIAPGNMARLARTRVADNASREERAAEIFVHAGMARLNVLATIALALLLGLAAAILSKPTYMFWTTVAMQSKALYLAREYFELQKTPLLQKSKRKNTSRL